MCCVFDRVYVTQICQGVNENPIWSSYAKERWFVITHPVLYFYDTLIEFLLVGSPSKKIVLPSVLDLQNNQDTRDQWIQYSARDAVATW